MSETENNLRQLVTETARELARRGLNRGAAGNVSARLGDEMLITPSGISYDVLRADQIVQMPFDALPGGAIKPSSEWRMHGDIYRTRDEAGAVIHTHSDYATALACLKQPIPAFHYMVAAAGGNKIACADYATFQTAELSASMLAGLGERRATLLAHHGMICYGKDLTAALKLAEEVEGLARQYILARSIGAVEILPDEEMDRVHKLFRTYGQKKA
ncbi:MAG TPA: class II aldolase [Rhizobiales bacterium]|nr:class II aldolase [Hyphomicrobiales bacterium]